MKSIKKFGFNQYNFEIFSHAGLSYLELNGSRIAKAEDVKVFNGYIDGFMKGHEKGYHEGSESTNNLINTIRAKVDQGKELQEYEKNIFKRLGITIDDQNKKQKLSEVKDAIKGLRECVKTEDIEGIESMTAQLESSIKGL